MTEKQIKIGIGVTTFNRPELLKICQGKIFDHTDKPFTFLIYNDSETKKGVAHAKNELIKTLYDAGCDYIFLFDEDCFPIKTGWQDYFIEAEHEHLVLANDQEHNLLKETHNRVKYVGSAGCFLFITRKVVERVGYFNTAYGQYGFEHSDYSQRIFRAGLTFHPFICLIDTSKYIYSMDLDGAYNGIEAVSTITREERLAAINKNRQLYLDNQKREIYLPYIQKATK